MGTVIGFKSNEQEREVHLTIKSSNGETTVTIHEDIDTATAEGARRLEIISELIRRGAWFVFGHEAEVRHGDNRGETVLMFMLGRDGRAVMSTNTDYQWNKRMKEWALKEFKRSLKKH